MLGGEATSLDPEAGEDSPSGASLRGSHRLAAVETCERMWALRYYWYFRGNKDNEWRLGGSLIHTCYQYYYASLLPVKPPWYFEKTLQERLAEQSLAMPEPKRSELVKMALTNLHYYMQVYSTDREILRPLHIEEEFAATLGELDPGGPWPELDNDLVTCRPDLVYEIGPWIWILDYKSHGRSRVNPKTGRLTRWKEDGEYAINWQVLINLLILRKRLGPRVRGFVIQRTTRQEPYDFDRTPLTIPQIPYEEAARTARELVRHEYQVMSKIEQGERPSARYHACYGRFGPCDYRYACLSPDRETMQKRLNSEYNRANDAEVTRLKSRLRVVQ